MEQEELRQYISEKIALETLTEVQRDEIVEKLLRRISAALGIAIMESLNEEDKNEFVRLSRLEKNAEVIVFVKEKVEDLPLLTDKAANEVIDEFNRLVQAQ